jgi:hypothetical protein
MVDIKKIKNPSVVKAGKKIAPKRDDSVYKGAGIKPPKNPMK